MEGFYRWFIFARVKEDREKIADKLSILGFRMGQVGRRGTQSGSILVGLWVNGRVIERKASPAPQLR
jgi:hypothetical protein